MSLFDFRLAFRHRFELVVRAEVQRDRRDRVSRAAAFEDLQHVAFLRFTRVRVVQGAAGRAGTERREQRLVVAVFAETDVYAFAFEGFGGLTGAAVVDLDHAFVVFGFVTPNLFGVLVRVAFFKERRRVAGCVFCVFDLRVAEGERVAEGQVGLGGRRFCGACDRREHQGRHRQCERHTAPDESSA